MIDRFRFATYAHPRPICLRAFSTCKVCTFKIRFCARRVHWGKERKNREMVAGEDLERGKWKARLGVDWVDLVFEKIACLEARRRWDSFLGLNTAAMVSAESVYVLGRMIPL